MKRLNISDNLTEEIKSKRDLEWPMLIKWSLDVELREYRNDLKEVQSEVNTSAINATKLEAMINNHLARLNDEYRMTYEYAVEHYLDEIDIEQAKLRSITN